MGLGYFALFKIGYVLLTDLKLIWNFANFVQGPASCQALGLEYFSPKANKVCFAVITNLECISNCAVLA